MTSSLTRRRLLAAAAGIAGGGLALDRLLAGSSTAEAPIRLGSLPAGLPARQFAWDATLARDSHGNTIAPRFNRLLFFDLRGRPETAGARRLEAAMRSLEGAYDWGPRGLLFTLGWGTAYFERRLGTSSPVPRARALSDFELPAIDEFDLCLHLASDREVSLDAIEDGLVRGAALPGSRASVDVRSVLRWRQTRTGFKGAGLPAAHQDVSGIPPGRPVPADAPLYMGFQSGYRRNQAGEDAVAIEDGRFAQGTTMQVSRMRLRLESWYGGLDRRERIARMFAPQVTAAEVARFTDDAPSQPGRIGEAARRDGVVGHAQASARARVHGRPRILRRDFDSDDGGEACLHFVSLQRSIEDFVATRSAMNASAAIYENPSITPTVNNGINSYIFVTHRANYLIPPRPGRSFPGVPLDAGDA